MKVYLAARYSRHSEMRGYASQLRGLGHGVTSRWILGDHEIRTSGHAEDEEFQVVWALEDWADLSAASVVISFTERPGDIAGRARGGRHTEYGMALALGKRVLVVGYRENVFHHLPQAEFCPTWNDALALLKKE